MNLTKLFSAVTLLTFFLSFQSFAQEAELSSGDWVGVGYKIEGNWKIVERDSGKYIVFDDAFKTKSGPDLKVYLSRKPIGDLKDRTVERNSVKIAPLQSSKGSQEFQIPNELNLGEFSSVVVHCEAYSHLWGGGDIK